MSGASLHNRLTPEQAAARIGVSRATLFRLRAKGEGPEYLQLGGRTYYDPSKISDWLEKQRRIPASKGVVASQVHQAIA